jgi:uncharacterized membrane protein YjgN (DUF898 family)
MDAVASAPEAGDDRAIRFAGNWREYLPIAATNALLIICTLGVYRFWAAARQRRYLWSRTHVIDDTLEWTGTGKEMFIGFLIVIAILAPFFLFIQFLLPAMAARGYLAAAGFILLFFYIALIYLGGFARFRALRYRLSRTYWHGIRGGSDNPGWSYGFEYLGRNFLVGLTFGLAFPWAQTELWNSRWNAMSFGPMPFQAGLSRHGLMARWLLVYAAPILAVILGLIVGSVFGASSEVGPGPNPTLGAGLIIVGVLFYIAIPLATLHWYAKYYRHAAAETRIGDLEFGFDATTWQWLKLFLGNIALAIVTLGFGLTDWGYRNGAFMVRHMHVYGSVELSELTQSTTHSPREAEGFADAFDIGAI